MQTSHTPCTILAIVQAKPGKEQEVKAILISLIQPTLQEEGCINYDVHECDDTPGKFMFYENWTTKEAHAKHRETSHIKAWHAKKSDLLNNEVSNISFWKMIK